MDEHNVATNTENVITGDFPLTREVAREVISLKSVSSTNTYAQQLVQAGEFSTDGMTVVAAQEQLAGHGRLARHWVSAPGESFVVTFVSAVARDLAYNADYNGWLPMIVGLSVIDALRETLHETGLRFIDEAGVDQKGVPDDVMLKWPNDIVYHGKKLGGILVQVMPVEGNDDLVAIIFGVGLNLGIPREELPTDESTSWQLITEPLTGEGERVSTDRLADLIASKIVPDLENRLWIFGEKPKEYAHDVQRRVTQECWTLGRPVLVHYVDGTVERGVAREINADASLQMTADSGTVKNVQTADVGILPE